MGAGLAIAGAVQAAGQIGYGIYQNKQAKKGLKALGSQPLYKYDQAKNAVAGQLALAQGEAPGLTQQLQGVNQNLANTTQNIQTMAPSGAAGLGALVQANASGMQSYADIYGQAAQNKLGLQQNYLQGVAGLQSYADKAYETNQYLPYMQKYQQLNDLKAAGAENVGKGIQGAFDTIGSSLTAKSGVGSAFSAETIKSANYSQDQVKNFIASFPSGTPIYEKFKTEYATKYPDLFK